MTDYIKREDALEQFDYYDLGEYLTTQIRDMLMDIPSADVAPVRHGRWLTTYRYGFPIWECSECGTQTGTANFPYCYDCGAKMDGEK
jgi:ribosomal protein L37AE/L43A